MENHPAQMAQSIHAWAAGGNKSGISNSGQGRFLRETFAGQGRCLSGAVRAMENRKAITMKTLLIAASLCSMVFAASAQAQTVDVKGNTAGATALTQRGATLDGKNSTAGAATASPGLRAEMAPAPDSNTHIVPKPTPKGGAGTTARLQGNQSADAPGADLKNLTGPDAQVARSADADAHRTVYDPNNQRGGAQGHTPTVPGVNADADASTDASAEASADANMAAGADAAAPQ
jgi:hypothetical protein